MSSERARFLRHVAQTSPGPLMIEVARAEGVYLYGPDGQRYTDLISGIGVANVGHGHPAIVAAVQAQAARYLHTMVYGEYVLSPQVALATALAEQLGPGLDQVYFVNSGAEAVEGALKLAKKATGRTQIVSFERSYHGSTIGAMSVSGGPQFKEGYGPMLPGVTHIEYNDFTALDAITPATACVLVEPVRGEAGVHLPAHGYLAAIRARCDATGALLIFDEIQSGYGRTGSLYAFQQLGVRPDILLTAKGFGGGMPLGAFISRAELMQVFTHDPVLGHITTFGGHPVSCAAGLAALEVLLQPGFLAAVPQKGALIERLADVPGVREVRGIGLLRAIELGSFEKVQQVIAHCLANGVITDWFLHCDTALRIAPPLTITEEELAAALEVVSEGIRRGKGQGARGQAAC
jgi:acetylornithine/succinyldiaminopimelate/putrescine aminotransferase